MVPGAWVGAGACAGASVEKSSGRLRGRLPPLGSDCGLALSLQAIGSTVCCPVLDPQALGNGFDGISLLPEGDQGGFLLRGHKVRSLISICSMRAFIYFLTSGSS
jgi:hypothetical protein